MGGEAFSQAIALEDGQPTLSTPRMQPETFLFLRDRYAKKLANCLPEARIINVREAPGKASHGDIDFLIATSDTIDFEHVAAHIGARGYLHRGPHKASFAVRQDGSPDSKSTRYIDTAQERSNSRLPPAQVTTDEAYAQIDISVIEPEIAEWQVFLGSYSDLGGIIGGMIRNVGFLLNTTGLFLRLQEASEAKKKPYLAIPETSGTIFLTNKPLEIMQFLGLNVAKYEAGFECLDDLYSWLSDCKYLIPEAVCQKRDISRDRRKFRTRPIFTRYFEAWLPENKSGFANEESKDGSEDERRATLREFRESTLQDAIRYFHIEKQFIDKRSKLIRTIENDTAAYLLKPIVSEVTGKEGAKSTEVVRAFRRWVGFDDDDELQILSHRHADEESQLYRLLGENKESLRDVGKVTDWVAGHWEEVRSLERHRGRDLELDAIKRQRSEL